MRANNKVLLDLIAVVAKLRALKEKYKEDAVLIDNILQVILAACALLIRSKKAEL